MGTSGHVLGSQVNSYDTNADVSADYMQATRMVFDTKEAAIAFAEKQGSHSLDARTDDRVGILHPRTTQ